MIRQLIPVCDDRMTKGVHVMVGSNKGLEKRCRVLVRATRAGVSLKERLGDDRTILDNTDQSRTSSRAIAATSLSVTYVI